MAAVQLESLGGGPGGSEPLADSRARVKTFTFDHVYNSQLQVLHGAIGTTTAAYATQQFVSYAVHLLWYVISRMVARTVHTVVSEHNVCVSVYFSLGWLTRF